MCDLRMWSIRVAFRAPVAGYGLAQGPVVPGKLMSCDSEPLWLIASPGSEPASAVRGRLPLKMSRMLRVWTSYPVR